MNFIPKFVQTSFTKFSFPIFPVLSTSTTKGSVDVFVGIKSFLPYPKTITVTSILSIIIVKCTELFTDHGNFSSRTDERICHFFTASSERDFSAKNFDQAIWGTRIKKILLRDLRKSKINSVADRELNNNWIWYFQNLCNSQILRNA